LEATLSSLEEKVRVVLDSFESRLDEEESRDANDEDVDEVVSADEEVEALVGEVGSPLFLEEEDDDDVFFSRGKRVSARSWNILGAAKSGRCGR